MTMPAISDQDMNAMLAEESRVCPWVLSLICCRYWFIVGKC